MTRIERATMNDVSGLIPLIAEYWRFEAIADFEPQRIEVQLKRVISEPGLGAVWIAFVADVPVAYLIAVYVFSLEHLGITAEIDELFVLPPERGKGIGTQLLKTAESEFRCAGCTNVSLQLSRNNDAARTFYHSNGYTERPTYELLDKTLKPGVSVRR